MKKLYSRLTKTSGGAALTLTPGPHRATDTVTAAIELAEQVDGITNARIELGYVNTYQYRWAGRHDAAANFDDTSLLTIGQVGTDHGSEKQVSDWVGVLDEPLPVAGGSLRAGTHEIPLRIPSWAPGSSKSTVRWEVRARIERSGRDIEVTEPFEVLIAAPDPPPTEMPLLQGERAMFNTIEWDITTDRTCYRVGDTVKGEISMTPREPIDRTAELAVYFVTLYTSHPLERTPGSDTDSQTRPPVKIAKDLQLTQGETTTLPYEIVIPSEVDPTTEAVHSSLDVFVHARVMFSGATGGVESAKRGIVVHTG